MKGTITENRIIGRLSDENWNDYFCAEYKAVYRSFEEKPSIEGAVAQNAFVQTLVSAGIWSKLDVFQYYAQETEDESLINWVNPGTNDGALRSIQPV